MTRQWLQANWPAPVSVLAVVSTRAGGVSRPPWASFNPAGHVGDDPDCVAENRRLLVQDLSLPREPQWLTQVHGTCCLQVQDIRTDAPEADALYTDRPDQPLAILTADCLPVFVCNQAGTEIALAHAGWRGLADGVIESTLACFRSPPQSLLAWLGPAIGPQAFQVGEDVRQAFLDGSPAADRAAVAAAFRPEADGRHRADLYALARLRLQRAGVTAVHGGGYCTWRDSARFFSYRRDGVTGRMASVLMLRKNEAL